MTDEYELLRLDEVDSQGDLISSEDFPNVDGQSVIVTVAFDPLSTSRLPLVFAESSSEKRSTIRKCPQRNQFAAT